MCHRAELERKQAEEEETARAAAESEAGERAERVR